MEGITELDFAIDPPCHACASSSLLWPQRYSRERRHESQLPCSQLPVPEWLMHTSSGLRIHLTASASGP